MTPLEEQQSEARDLCCPKCKVDGYVIEGGLCPECFMCHACGWSFHKVGVPQFKTADEYRNYMADRRAAYDAAPAENKTTNGPSIPLNEIRKFQQSHDICTDTKDTGETNGLS